MSEKTDKAGAPYTGLTAEMVKTRAEAINVHIDMLNKVPVEEPDWVVTMTTKDQAALLDIRQSPEVVARLVGVISGLMKQIKEPMLYMAVSMQLEDSLKELFKDVSTMQAEHAKTEALRMMASEAPEDLQAVNDVVREFLDQMEKQDENSNGDISDS